MYHTNWMALYACYIAMACRARDGAHCQTIFTKQILEGKSRKRLVFRVWVIYVSMASPLLRWMLRYCVYSTNIKRRCYVEISNILWSRYTRALATLVRGMHVNSVADTTSEFWAAAAQKLYFFFYLFYFCTFIMYMHTYMTKLETSPLIALNKAVGFWNHFSQQIVSGALYFCCLWIDLLLYRSMYNWKHFGLCFCVCDRSYAFDAMVLWRCECVLYCGRDIRRWRHTSPHTIISASALHVALYVRSLFAFSDYFCCGWPLFRFSIRTS